MNNLKHNLKLISLTILVILISFFIIGILYSNQISEITKSISPHNQLAQVPSLDNGLVAHYTFDDGTATDSSGNNNNGTLQGGPTPVAGNVGSGALSFDGGDDYINIPDSSVFDSLEGSSGATVAFWVKNNNQLAQFVNRDSGINGRFLTISGSSFFTMSTAWRYGGSGTGGSALTINCNAATCPIPLGQWTHIVVMYNDPTSYVYINGVQKATTNGTGGALNTNISTPLKIGTNHLLSAFASATMDDIRVYNRALTADEVGQLYSLGGGTVPPQASIN